MKTWILTLLVACGLSVKMFLAENRDALHLLKNRENLDKNSKKARERGNSLSKEENVIRLESGSQPQEKR